MSDDCLDVPRKEFVQAIRLLSRTIRVREGEQALLSFDGDLLYIEAAGGSTSVPASGEWPWQVRVGAKSLLNLAKVPPRLDPVQIQRDGNEIKIETMALHCDVQEPWKSEIQLPLDPSLADILDLEQNYSHEQIMAAGLTASLESAKADRNAALDKALKILAPLGVRLDDLQAALGNAHKRRLGENREA